MSELTDIFHLFLHDVADFRSWNTEASSVRVVWPTPHVKATHRCFSRTLRLYTISMGSVILLLHSIVVDADSSGAWRSL